MNSHPDVRAVVRWTVLGIERLDAHIKGGCQRFMLQIPDYDDLNPVASRAADNLSRFRGG